MPVQLLAEQEWTCISVSRIKADGSDARISTGVEQCSGFRRHSCISAWHADDPVLCVNHSGLVLGPACRIAVTRHPLIALRQQQAGLPDRPRQSVRQRIAGRIRSLRSPPHTSPRACRFHLTGDMTLRP